MRFRIPLYLQMAAIVPIAVFLAIDWRAAASPVSASIPKFGTPIVHSNLLVFSWPDATEPKVIAIDRTTGAKRWEAPVPGREAIVWPGLNSPFLSDRTNLYILDPGTGKQSRIFSGARTNITRVLQPNPNQITILSAGGPINELITVGGENWQEQWRRPQVTRILDYDKNRFLVESAQPELMLVAGRRDVFRFSTKGEVQAVSALDGALEWSFPWTNVVYGVLSQEYAVISQSGQIICLDAAHGMVQKSLKAMSPNHGIPLWEIGDGIARLSGASQIKGLTLPGLQERRIVELERPAFGLRDLIRVGGVLLGRGWHEPIGFDAGTGKRLWPESLTPERFGYSDIFQDWEGVHNGKIYLSRASVSGGRTFIEAVDVKTGARRELYSMPLPRP